MTEPLFDPTYLNLEYLFYQVLELIRAIYRFLATLGVYWLKILLAIAAILFIIILVYSYKRIMELRKKEKERLAAVVIPETAEPVKNERWEHVQMLISSTNPNDWKLAIIEADLILDEMVARMRYPGENLGDRLKKVEKSDFQTIDDAWDAHKVRNRIAHEGSAFQLDLKEAKRVIDLYERVFREFNYI
jgi:hypothetical protein